jgi:hypothetical protein
MYWLFSISIICCHQSLRCQILMFWLFYLYFSYTTIQPISYKWFLFTGLVYDLSQYMSIAQRKYNKEGRNMKTLCNLAQTDVRSFQSRAKQMIAIHSHTTEHGKWKIYGYTRTWKAYGYYLMPCIMSDAGWTSIFVLIKGLSTFCNKSLNTQMYKTNFSHFICTSEKVRSIYACHNTRFITP